ncbi:MAG: hypothetical protein KC493_01495 [Bacteriovoracaceae bacterium]|nr:hypothetical protein [Bacteriovoracaceae bacterium]
MKLILIIGLMGLLTSCASSSDRQIEEEKTHVRKNMSKKEMSDKMIKILESSKRLTKKQKEDFLVLHSNVKQDVTVVNDELRRLKIVLFQTLAKGEYKRKKIDLIKKKIVKQYNKRLNIMFDALYKFQKILGVGSGDFYQNEWFPIHFTL